METKNQYYPDRITSPGVTLEAKIQEMGLSVSSFAKRALRSEQSILNIIEGKERITPELALIFENITLIPARFWMKRQKNYDMATSVVENIHSNRSSYQLSPLNP